MRVFCDFHGHSCQKNVFMYGCSRMQSWWPGDRELPDDPDYKVSFVGIHFLCCEAEQKIEMIL